MTLSDYRMLKTLGYGLIALSTLAWIAVFIVPFLDLSVGQIAAFITALIIFAEVTFYLAILLLGKPLWQKIKQTLSNKLNRSVD
ncbi:transporter suffix domain-containing protein [Thiomicrorhabdus aquaedulcis]|uniref:transporter suffix domain-containing protein n=1 Tax=Thiomicrorhabdus aquaedulcis TaxID=2211106 RepID=UPI000FDA1A00|nr:transporter suffix domain-containing protein [Thiomicrorhabdus aquaedulcis]